MAKYFESEIEALRAVKKTRRLVQIMLCIVTSMLAYAAYKTFFK